MIKEFVQNIIAEHLGVNIEKVKEEALLSDDLGADSLDPIEITMMIEEKFKIEISDDEHLALKTVGDYIKIAEEKVRALCLPEKQ